MCKCYWTELLGTSRANFLIGKLKPLEASAPAQKYIRLFRKATAKLPPKS
jgi:hypothetical protein